MFRVIVLGGVALVGAQACGGSVASDTEMDDATGGTDTLDSGNVTETFPCEYGCLHRDSAVAETFPSELPSFVDSGIDTAIDTSKDSAPDSFPCEYGCRDIGVVDTAETFPSELPAPIDSSTGETD
jgi:hypothetical protein